MSNFALSFIVLFALWGASPLNSGVANAETAHFNLTEDISGPDFFTHFNFETIDDPTHGHVDYVRESRARYLNLLHYDAKTGRTRIDVESTENSYGRGRASVRLSSKSTFTTGLFLIDVQHVPEGNATWPAFWLFGPDWPNSGEIDVIEGINNQPNNQSTLHTSSGCVMPTPSPATMTGTFLQSLDCNYIDGTKGCSTQGPVGSFGPGLNAKGGGVFALLWTTQAISVWFWPRQQVPAAISLGVNPDPSQWGLPVSYFPFGNSCPASHFVNHNVILNTTFCGDWAGPNFKSDSGSGVDACNYYVHSNPAQFQNAYWDIQSIRIYAVQPSSSSLR